MTETAGEETATSESGGSMVRLVGAAAPRPVDLSLLESERNVGTDWREAGAPPHQARDWPLDEEWMRWRPPADWTVPALPDTDLARRARATTLPS